MKNKIQSISQRIVENPALRQSVELLKPKINIWGVLGIILFFISPEIIGFVWGSDIATWAHAQVFNEPTAIGRQVYWLLEEFFKNGGSWLNLGIGILLLVWLLKDWITSKKKE